MNAVLGYFLCLAILMPALSLDVFFGLLSKTNRQHEVLALIRSIVQMFVTVTSPFKIALTLAVLLCAYAFESDGLKRGSMCIFVSIAAFAGLLHIAALSRGVDFGAATVLFPSALVTIASFAPGTRGEGTDQRCGMATCFDCGTT